MKDKLKKHHKKPSYFLRRKILIIVSVILLSGAAIGIPVGLSIFTKSAIQLVK